MAKKSDPLRAYRESNNLTQQEVADELEVSRGLIAQLETGAKPYTPEMAVRIEKTLGIPRERMRPDLFSRAAA